jgi:hypothetical protein
MEVHAGSEEVDVEGKGIMAKARNDIFNSS